MQFYFERQHRNESFTYLLYLGVDPDHRNKGIASQLTKPYLEKALAEGLPVYLETANPVNVEIYKKIGFFLYHSWKVPVREDLTVFFMKKELSTESETF